MTGTICSFAALPWKSGRGRAPTRAMTLGTAWTWNAWAIWGAASTSTSTNWKAPAFSRAISSSTPMVGFDSRERCDHRTRTTGTVCEVDMTSWKPASSISVTSGIRRPSPGPSGWAVRVGAAARSTAPRESAARTVVSCWVSLSSFISAP